MGARDEQNWDETPRMLRADVNNILERLEALEDRRDEVQALRQSVQTQARVVSDMNTRLSNVQHIADGSEIADLRTKQRHLAHDVDSILEINRGILARLGALEQRPAPAVEVVLPDEVAALREVVETQRRQVSALTLTINRMDRTVQIHGERLLALEDRPTPTVFPPTEDDVTRAYNRGIAEGRRQAFKQMGDALMVSPIMDYLGADSDDANGEEASNG